MNYANFFEVLDVTQLTIRSDDKELVRRLKKLAREEGIFAGGSSGSAVAVAVEVARELGAGKRVVVILPDHGNRYLTKMYSDEWMRDNSFLDEEPKLGTVRTVLGPTPREVVSIEKDHTILEAARIILGHHSSAVTEIYAEKNEREAIEAITKVG